MPEGKMLWTYRAVFKQTAGGGGAILVRIAMSERTTVQYIAMGANDYAADRNLNARLLDSGDKDVGRLSSTSPFDNEVVAIPSDFPSVTLPPNFVNSWHMKPIIGAGDQILFTASGIVLNEELTISIHALIKTTKPVVTTTGSGGTVTTTVTYDKVI